VLHAQQGQERFPPIGISRLKENLMISFSVEFLGYLSASNEPRSGGTSLPARSRFGEGRWVVKYKRLHDPNNDSAKIGYRNQFTGSIQRSVP
jgi:hypothetical protein